MTEVAQTFLNIGPWASLAIASICVVSFLVFLSLRNLLKNSIISPSSLEEKVNRIELNQTKMSERQTKMCDDICAIKSDVSYIHGRLNGKPIDK